MKLTHIKLLFTFCFVLAMATVVWYMNYMPTVGIDDANIYMVYMRNFANGHGFVYNIGGEKVEGFTSLLWTLVGSSLYLLNDSPETIMLFLNVTLVSLGLWKLVSFIDIELLNSKAVLSPASFLLFGLLAVVPGYFEWTVLSLMETGLWSSLLIFSFIETIKIKNPPWKLCLLLALLVICRPESLLWGMVLIGIRFLNHFTSSKDFRKSILATTPMLVVFIMTVTLLTIWRKWYFGFPLPNTYYAKVTSDRLHNLKEGIKYIYFYLTDSPIAILIIITSAVVFIQLLRSKRLAKSEVFFSLFIILGTTLIIPLYTGKDHFAYSRFMQPTTPIIYACFIIALRHLKINYSYFVVACLLPFLLFTSEHSLIKYYMIEGKSYLTFQWQLSKKGRIRSERLNDFFKELPKLPSQGVLPAGGTAYGYKGFTNDLLGLNNVEMAHTEKLKSSQLPQGHAGFNKSVFYKQQPDLLWMSGKFLDIEAIDSTKQTVSLLQYHKDILKNVHQETLFNKLYTYVIIQKKSSKYKLRVFAKKDFLDNTLDKNIYTYQTIPFQ